MDRAELERIYDAHAEAIFRYFLFFTRNESDTRDLLQDICVKMARGADGLAGVRNERSYLYRVAHNQAVDWVRRSRVRRERTEQFGDGTGKVTLVAWLKQVRALEAGIPEMKEAL